MLMLDLQAVLEAGLAALVFAVGLFVLAVRTKKGDERAFMFLISGAMFGQSILLALIAVLG